MKEEICPNCGNKDFAVARNMRGTRMCRLLIEENERLQIAVKTMLPIVREAFWDTHTAGTLPGSGYNNKAQRLASQEWGWQSSKDYQKWEKEVIELIQDAEAK